MARSITSCTFIIRSISAAEIAGLVASTSQRHLPPGFKRTDHVLLGPDRSHANNTSIPGSCNPLRASAIIPTVGGSQRCASELRACVPVQRTPRQERRMRNMSRALWLGSLCIVGVILRGADPTGTVAGTVLDPSGRAIVGAQITVFAPAT